MARFWAVPVFSNEVWTVWSAYTTADYPARPGRSAQPNLPTQKPSWQWRNISLFTFLAGRTKEQVLDKGIRQKSTKRVGSIVVCTAFCPGSPKRDPLTRTSCFHFWRLWASHWGHSESLSGPFIDVVCPSLFLSAPVFSVPLHCFTGGWSWRAGFYISWPYVKFSFHSFLKKDKLGEHWRLGSETWYI